MGNPKGVTWQSQRGSNPCLRRERRTTGLGAISENPFIAKHIRRSDAFRVCLECAFLRHLVGFCNEKSTRGSTPKAS